VFVNFAQKGCFEVNIIKKIIHRLFWRKNEPIGYEHIKEGMQKLHPDLCDWEEKKEDHEDSK
jgi:hypothetical protein